MKNPYCFTLKIMMIIILLSSCKAPETNSRGDELSLDITPPEIDSLNYTAYSSTNFSLNLYFNEPVYANPYSTDGACSGDIQISSDEFVSCIDLNQYYYYQSYFFLAGSNKKFPVIDATSGKEVKMWLDEGTTYKVKVTTNVKDTSGNLLDKEQILSFSTDDYKAPTNPTVIINNSEDRCETTSVSLKLSATDNAGITGYYLSTTDATPDATSDIWNTVTETKNYSITVPYSLSAGEEIKTVYAWFKDAANRVSYVASDSILFSKINLTHSSTITPNKVSNGITLSPDNTKLYIAIWENTPLILEYKLSDLSLLQSILTSRDYHGDLVISNNGNDLFITNNHTKSLSRIQLDSANAETKLATGNDWPCGVAISPDDTKVLVESGVDKDSLDQNNDSVDIYDITGGGFSLLSSLTLYGEPGCHNIAFSSDSKFAYMATKARKSSYPALFEVSLTPPYQITRSIEFNDGGTQLNGVACHGDNVYVSIDNSNHIQQVNRTSWTQTGLAVTDGTPTTIKLHPGGKYLFALIPEQKTISAISLNAMTVTKFSSPLVANTATDIAFTTEGNQMLVSHRDATGKVLIFQLSISSSN